MQDFFGSVRKLIAERPAEKQSSRKETEGLRMDELINEWDDGSDDEDDPRMYSMFGEPAKLPSGESNGSDPDLSQNGQKKRF